MRPGHWAVRAAHRLDALGLSGTVLDHGERSLTRRDVACAMIRAVEATRSVEATADADGGRSDLARLARAYLDRMTDEFPDAVEGARGDRVHGLGLGGGWQGGAVETRRGAALTGSGYPGAPGAPRTGAQGISDETDLDVLTNVSGELFPYLAVHGSVPNRVSGPEIDEFYGVAALGWLGGWGGFRTEGWGPGRGGSVVLSNAPSFGGGGVFLTRGVTLPSILRYLGTLHFDAFVAQIDSSGPIKDPYFVGAHAALSPHTRLDIGFNRGVILGGEGNADPSALDLLYVFVGKHAESGSGLENQVASIDLGFRPPLGALPLELYIEWGFDDSAGAIGNVPGIIAGAFVPGVPGMPELALGAEFVRFAESCCGNPAWYRHIRLDDGWAVDGRPLGHPLGGHGTEWSAYAAADLFAARLNLDARAFVRDRGDENLYVPGREGGSVGGTLDIGWKLLENVQIIAEGAIEDGETGWRETSGRVGARLVF